MAIMQPWNIVYVVGFVVYVAIRAHFEKQTKGNEKLMSRAEGDWILLGLMGIGCLVLPVMYLFTPWLNFANYQLPAFVPWCGLVVMVLALWFFYRAHADLGRNWSITLVLRQDHQLITNGIYRTIRHPMYAGIWLFALAQGLMLENWLAGWMSFVAFALMYVIRIPKEEGMMIEHFGQEYRDYMRKTGRLWPRIRIEPKDS